MRPASAVAATCLTALVATGCSGAPVTAPPSSPAVTATSPSSTGAPAPSPSATASVTAAPAATAAPVTDPGTLTMAFAGDIHFEDYLAPLARDPHGLDELQTTLGAADLAMVNLETAITQRGAVIGKEFHFRAPATALDTIRGAGIDAVSMANNHGVDYGPVGLQDTLAAKQESPVPVVGIGGNEDEAFAPVILQAKGLKVAVLGASQVYEMTLANWSAGPGKAGIASSMPTTRIRRAVQNAAKQADLVVVFLHWGTDYQACPDELSVQTARLLEQAGADIIVGGHSHRVNGAGWLGRSYVHYGLGNFVWWRSREPDARSGVLTLSVDVAAAKGTRRTERSAVREAIWTPMLIGTDGIPREPDAANSARLLKLWNQSRTCANLAATPE